ncbi:uroporphyrinogen decarboxylase/cobalamine-independent methonine synthase family protein [Ornithinimicrobium sediminis]|uniref:methionine synthase n=1 Tax=Ornithinimicrobium sediminis TaxID=2904603 RepID=UPI001E3395E2|nr:methionine synthase [Ornithinimicrobium sediminis]MCE0485533.1 methionine synthase [Ornithinimicrobium sediminis]
MVGVSGIGSWPGTDVREAVRVVRDVLGEASAEGVTGLPYLPELPARGPGADMVGRATRLLVDLAVDLQPQGWRLVDRPGRDAERTASFWRHDLDELAEAYDGWSGPLKVQVGGPWTLASELWLPLGDRVLSDAGATRDLCASLAEGVAGHVGEVRRLVPGAEVVLQVDEPSLGTVLLGRVRSESGYRVLRAPEAAEAVAALRQVLDGAVSGGAARTVVHYCAAPPPVPVLRDARPDALSLDVTALGARAWESLAVAVEAGTALWAGLVPADGDPTAYRGPHDDLVARWGEVGLPRRDLADVTVTPACGLAGATPRSARALTEATVRLAGDLAESAAG